MMDGGNSQARAKSLADCAGALDMMGRDAANRFDRPVLGEVIGHVKHRDDGRRGIGARAGDDAISAGQAREPTNGAQAGISGSPSRRPCHGR